jgi:GST-like protein
VIELYTWATPNGTKPSIMLEEAGLDYRVTLIDLVKGEQFAPEFLAISPNNKIPTLIDRDEDGERRIIFESGAILIYLAEKAGVLLPTAGPSRDRTLEWLFWASAGVGPMFGQFGHFAGADLDQAAPARARFTKEAWRLIEVLERRLGLAPYLAGDYSVADIAAFTWVHATLPTLRAHGQTPTPHIDLWLQSIASRPAVQRGLRAPKIRIRAHP